MADVQIAVIDQQNTEVTLAVPGVQGPVGEGVPSGGTTNQVLFKQSGTDYDTAWSEVTSAMIGDLEIVNADVAAGAEIAVSKLADGSARQLLQTDAAGTGVEWTSNVDVPGTLDVTGATTLDSTLTVPLGSAAAPTVTFTGDTNTGIYSPGADQLAISTNGTGRLFVDSSGHVGLNESSPSTYSAGSGIPGLVLRGTSGSFPARSGALALLSQDGTTAKTWLYHDTNLYIQNATATNTLFYTNNQERMRITSAGLVGIGTSSPISKMQVVDGDITVTTSSSFVGFNSTRAFSPNALGQQLGRLNFNAYSTGTTYVTGASVQAYSETAWSASSAPSYLSLQTTSSGSTSPTSRVHIDSSGRVGIGTTAPIAQLDVATVGDSSIVLSNETTYTDGIKRGRITKKTDNSLEIRACDSASSVATVFLQNISTESCRIDSSGRLLVGTSSAIGNGADNRDTITAVATGGGGLLLGRNDTNTTDGNNLGKIEFWGNDSDGTYEQCASIIGEADGTHETGDKPTRLVFSTTADGAPSPTERMRIDSGGLVLIGATSFPGAGTSTTGTGFGTSGSISVHRTAATPCYFGRSNDGEVIALYSGTTQRGTVSISGATTTYGSVSDYRLKENIAPIDEAASKVSRLKPSRFNFVEFPDQQINGFIAHEVQEVVPEAVIGAKDATDEDGKPIYQSIDQSKLVPLLTAALQEALAEISALKDRVAALEAS